MPRINRSRRRIPKVGKATLADWRFRYNSAFNVPIRAHRDPVDLLYARIPGVETPRGRERVKNAIRHLEATQ